jgi:hypothetical protein
MSYLKFSKWMFVFCILLLGFLLVACGNEPVEMTPETVAQEESEPTEVPDTVTPVPPTETATVTATAVPTDTATPTPVPTDTATPTPVPTNTATATPEPTDTPEPTHTPAHTATPLPTVPPPTNTPAPISAPVFPETPIRPFNADDFIKYLGLVRDSFRSFNSEMGLFQQTGKPGDCGTFIGWTRLWILESPGYLNVPSAWQSLYGEYRNMLNQIADVTEEIRPLCSGSGGSVSQETTQRIFDFLSWAYPRSEQMVIEAGQIPR